MNKIIVLFLLFVNIIYANNNFDNNFNIKNIISDKEIILNKDTLENLNIKFVKNIKNKKNPFNVLNLELNDKKIIDIQNKLNDKSKLEKMNDFIKTKYKIEMSYFNLINHINYYTSSLYKNKFNTEEIKKYLNKEKKYLNSLNNDITKYDNDIHKLYKGINKNLTTDIIYAKKIIDKEKRLFTIYSSFINYLNNNINYIFQENIIMETFPIDKYIQKINQINYLEKFNIFLQKHDLIDGGRIIIFLFSVFFFWLLKFLIILILFPFIRSKLTKVDNATSKIIHKNLYKIKKPISLLLILIGIEVGTKIIYYPDLPNINFEYIMSFLYIATITMLILSISDILFMILFSDTSKRKIKLRNEIVNLSSQIFKFFIIISAILIFLVKMNIEIMGLLAPLGIGGMAVAFAAKDTIANFFGGIKIITGELFSQEDWIKNSQVEGTVVEIGLMSTKIRTFDNALVIVPNSILANEPIVNWNRRKLGRRIKTIVGVTYESKPNDIKQAIKEIKEMVSKHPDIAQPNEKYQHFLDYDKTKLINMDNDYGVKNTQLVYLDEMGSSSINILVYIFSKTVKWEEWLKVKEDIYYKIWDILERNNLEYAFPTQTIYHKNIE